MAKHSIMVIDDEKIVGDMAKLSFEQDGYEVETFLNGESALERLDGKTVRRGGHRPQDEGGGWP